MESCQHVQTTSAAVCADPHHDRILALLQVMGEGLCVPRSAGVATTDRVHGGGADVELDALADSG
jgi:hypothetical protein